MVVITGLVPVIHAVFVGDMGAVVGTWMPGFNPGMTSNDGLSK